MGPPTLCLTTREEKTLGLGTVDHVDDPDDFIFGGSAGREGVWFRSSDHLHRFARHIKESRCVAYLSHDWGWYKPVLRFFQTPLTATFALGSIDSWGVVQLMASSCAHCLDRGQLHPSCPWFRKKFAVPLRENAELDTRDLDLKAASWPGFWPAAGNFLLAFLVEETVAQVLPNPISGLPFSWISLSSDSSS